MNFTALPECPLDSSIIYNCDNVYPNCTNPAAFQFASLWFITQAISNCTNDTRLYNHAASLTDAACKIFTNKRSWTVYPAADIWARLTTWKFPLLQLVAVFPRPPLTLLSQFFVIIHLLGDPISTIGTLLLRLASCQGRAEFWRDRFDDRALMGHLLRTENQFDDTAGDTFTRRWKGLAAIVDSYDEWGPDVGNTAENFILDRLTNSDVEEGDQRKFLELCRLTANALAADRSTKFLPIIVAQCFFISTIAIAFGRTRDSAAGPNPPTFINIEAHSIAFSSLYFWIIPAVIISSIIGVSQTEDAIPRILRRFSNDVHAAFPAWHILLPNTETLTSELRERSGGIYSWQPADSRQRVVDTILRHPYRIPQLLDIDNFWRRAGQWVDRSLRLRPGADTLPIIIFIYGALTGLLISYLVPPVGFDCRHVGELTITAAWLLSSLLTHLGLFNDESHAPTAQTQRKLFLFILWKDIVTTILTMGGIILTQIGIFNQCACYTLWGKVGLALPEQDTVAKTLFYRIDTIYPAISFLCVGFQLVVVPLFLVRPYGLAIRVFLQRDDEESNLPVVLLRFWTAVSKAGVWIGESVKSAGRGIRRVFRRQDGVQIYNQTSGPRRELLAPDTDNRENGEERAAVEMDAF